MNKNWEEAYRSEVQQNIPDLWDRIESGLPEKTPILHVQTDANEIMDVAAENLNIYKPNSKIIKKKNKYAWMKWASLSAACFLVILMLSALVGIGAFGLFMIGGKASGDTASAESENMVMDSGDSYDGCEDVYYEYEYNTESTNEDDFDSGWEHGMVAEGTEAEGEVAAEGVSSSAQETEEYRELFLEDMEAAVLEIGKTEEGVWYVTLEVTESDRNRADEYLEGNSFYEDGIIIVVVYEGTGEEPVVGESYRVDLYDCAPSHQSVIEPYEAVLSF